MTTWGITATVKTSHEKLLAFIAHHQELGAKQIWLYFDDPTDEAFAEITQIKGVIATLCDDAYWESLGKARPPTHQQRQIRNALRSYRRASCDWLCHIDADEFILPKRNVSKILAQIPPDQVMTRMRPYEAMHDPSLPDDIYTARLFRGAFASQERATAKAFLGESADILPSGMLSHTAGKGFYRRGIAGLTPRIHGAFIKGERVKCPNFNPALKLLHFHAQDRQAWMISLPFRLTKGAYQFNPDLQRYLQNASLMQIADFYDQTQCMKEGIRSESHLIEIDLNLREKVARLEGVTSPPPGHAAHDASAP